MVGDPGVEPGLPCSQSRRVTVSLASGGEVRNRTGSPTLAGRGRCLTCHPHCRCGAPVQAVPGRSWPIFRRTASVWRQDGACRGCSRYGHVKKQARKGRARTAGVEPASASFGDWRSTFELDPYKRRTARRKLLGRFPATQIRSYPGTSAMRMASVEDGWLCHPHDSFAWLNIMSKG
jgi:hypothetical protein